MLALTCLLAFMAVGCNPNAPAAFSPTPEQDPVRYEQARRADKAASQKNQDAEKALMKMRHRGMPSK
jgi:hypothetical protein